MADTTNRVIGVAIGLFVCAIIMPIALVTLSNQTWSGGSGATAWHVEPTVVTVLTILLPVLAVIGIAMAFFYYRS